MYLIVMFFLFKEQTTLDLKRIKIEIDNLYTKCTIFKQKEYNFGSKLTILYNNV